MQGILNFENVLHQPLLLNIFNTQMEREEKNKFSIIRSGQEQQVKLKAENQPEAEEWMKNILAAISLVCVRAHVRVRVLVRAYICV